MNTQAPLLSACGRLGRVVVLRLRPGDDLLLGLQRACEQYGIQNGVILSGIGSLARVRYCDVEPLPDKKCGYGYGRTLELNDTIELTGASGVICQDADGAVNLHVHMSLSDRTGRAFGGHLVEGTTVLMTADLVLGEIDGVRMLREYDPDMDVFLLNPSAPV